MTLSLKKETIAGVPLGYSRDYDHLPHTEPLRIVHCSNCWGLYEDAERRLTDGCRVMALMCTGCREQKRAQWIAENRCDLPRAVAILHKGIP